MWKSAFEYGGPHDMELMSRNSLGQFRIIRALFDPPYYVEKQHPASASFVINFFVSLLPSAPTEPVP